MTTLKTHYSASDIESRILKALREVGLNPEERLTPHQLGALDHFHTGGIGASRDLMSMAQIQASDHVLDIGAGLAGPARFLASEIGCQVDCIDMSADYCTGAKLLNRLTGLEEKIGVHLGSALNLPFLDHSFDVVWMQNVGMNICDKQKLYSEIFRVLKPGGRFTFQEMAAGIITNLNYPLPWATNPSDNYLLPIDEFHIILNRIGFEAVIFDDASELYMNGGPASTTPDTTPAPPLSLSAYVDDLTIKAANARKSLQEGQIRFVRAVFRTKS